MIKTCKYKVTLPEVAPLRAQFSGFSFVYVFCVLSCFLFFARAWVTVLYCDVIRKFLFNGFNSVFLFCAGACSVTVLA